MLDPDTKCLIQAILTLLNNQGMNPIVDFKESFVAIWLHSFICIRIFTQNNDFRIRSYQAGDKVYDEKVRRIVRVDNGLAYYLRNEDIIYLVANTVQIVKQDIEQTIKITAYTSIQ
jgi:hypothetical protein